MKSPSSVHVWWADSGAVWSHISTAMGLAIHGKAAKHEKKLTFYPNKSIDGAVAQRIPGQFWKMGYHIDPHVIPDSNAVLLFLGRSFFRPFRVL